MDVALLIFVFLAIPFCVGAIFGVLWRGRLGSLVLFVCGLALVCLVGWVVWRIDANIHRLKYYFTSLDGVAEFILVLSVGFGGGVGGALAAHASKWKLVRPPKLPAPPPAPTA